MILVAYTVIFSLIWHKPRPAFRGRSIPAEIQLMNFGANSASQGIWVAALFADSLTLGGAPNLKPMTQPQTGASK